MAGLLEGKPDLPAFKAIDPQKEQQKAIQGNVAQVPALESMASGINRFNADQLRQMTEWALPGYQAMKGNVQSNIDAYLRGELPKDVSDQVQNSAAARALGGGYGGSGMHGSLVARDLGLTSLDLIDKGLSSAQNWMKTVASLERPELFNFSSMFLTPGQQIAVDTGERNAKFQYDWNKNLMDWQSSPEYLGAQEMRQISSQWNQMAGEAVGSMAGAAGKAAGAAVGGGL